VNNANDETTPLFWRFLFVFDGRLFDFVLYAELCQTTKKLNFKFQIPNHQVNYFYIKNQIFLKLIFKIEIEISNNNQ